MDDSEWERGGSVQVNCLTSTPFADQLCCLLKDQNIEIYTVRRNSSADFAKTDSVV